MLAMIVLAGVTAFGQGQAYNPLGVDFSGYWSQFGRNQDAGLGTAAGDLGDYTGIPLSEAALTYFRQSIQLPTFIPVNLTYQTAFVDDDGKLQFRDDVYGRDKQLLAILKGDDRKMADVAVERREDPSHRQVLAIPDSTPLFGGRTYGGPGDGGNFFSRLFGGGFASTPPQPVRRATTHRRETSAGTPVQR